MANTFYINSVDKTSYIKRPSTVIEKRSDNKAYAFFDMSITASELGNPENFVGLDVKIYEDATLLFGGIIKKIRIRREEGGLGNTKKLTVAVTCNDYNDIPSRRVTSSYFSSTTAGAVVESMVDDVLGLTGFDDGVGKGTISTGATINVYSVNAKTVKDVLDDMAEASGYKWYIDDSKDLYFVQDDTVTDADHDLVETGATFTDFYVVNMDVDTTNYVNKQWVLGAVDDNGENVNVSATASLEIASRASVEGTSGVYGAIIKATEAQSVADANVVAANGIKANGKMPYYITFTSYTNDWVAGTKLKCNLPTIGLSTDTYFLIESVVLEDMGNTFMSEVTGTRRNESDFSTQRTETFDDYFSKIIKNATTSNETGNASISGRVYDVATTLPISLSTTTTSRTFDHDFPDVVDLLTTLTFQYTASAAVTLTLAYKDGATTDYTLTMDLPSGTDIRTISIPELDHASGEHTFTIELTASADSVLQLDQYLLTSRWEKYRDSYTGTSDIIVDYGEYELLADIEVTSATTQVDITGLSLTSDDEILLVSDWKKDAAGLYIGVNGDTTYVNYYHQNIFATGSTVSSSRANSNTYMVGTTSYFSQAITNINLTESGYFTYQSHEIRDYTNPSSIILTDYYGTKISTISSITSLNIYSFSANGIGVGSRFWLYKKGSAA